MNGSGLKHDCVMDCFYQTVVYQGANGRVIACRMGLGLVRVMLRDKNYANDVSRTLRLMRSG